MKLINNTNFLLDSYTRLNHNGIEYETVLLKGCFKMVPTSKNEDESWLLRAAKDQGEFFKKNIHFDNNKKASVRFEKDHVNFKLATDLIINATAYAPENKPTKQWEAGIEIGTHKKLLRVIGPRQWKYTNKEWTLTEPKACLSVPLRYENAYGGDAKSAKAINLPINNPTGKGVFNTQDISQSFPAHQIESIDNPIVNANEARYPEGFGFINKKWEPRKSMLAELTNKTKGLPKMVRAGIGHQAANYRGMVMRGYLSGSETVTLGNLLPGKSIQKLRLPSLKVSFKSILFPNQQHKGFLPLETVVFDIDAKDSEDYRVYLYWRMVHGDSTAIESIEVNAEEVNQ